MIEIPSTLEDEKKKKAAKIDLETYEKHKSIDTMKLELQALKQLVHDGMIDQQMFESIIEDKKVTTEEYQRVLNTLDIQKLFEKLEEIEKFYDEEQIISKAYQVNKQEYLQAFYDTQKREEVLQKFDASLSVIYNQVTGGKSFH
jgi:hypothetical protein